MSDFFRRNTFFGNVHFGEPGDGVEYEFAVVINRPITVVVATYEADATRGVFEVATPEQCLFSSQFVSRALVPKFRASVAHHVFSGRSCSSERMAVWAIFVEVEVPVKFVKGFD